MEMSIQKGSRYVGLLAKPFKTPPPAPLLPCVMALAVLGIVSPRLTPRAGTWEWVSARNA